MSAKEMFEALGYYEDTEHSSIYAIKVYRNKYRKTIYFDDGKTIDTTGNVITLDLLKAIYQQCKELGWLEDVKD